MSSCLIMYGRSDDLLIVEIVQDNRTVFEDEVSKWEFRVNDLFDVMWEHAPKGGWHVTFGNVDEDKITEYLKYDITLEVDQTLCPYSPTMKVRFDGPFELDGIYGGKKKAVMDVLADYIDGSWLSIEEAYDKLDKAGFLK